MTNRFITLSERKGSNIETSKFLTLELRKEKMKAQSVSNYDKKIHSVSHAGEMLGLSPWTIRQWCYSGKIASHKLGTRLMVPHSEIERVLSESLRPRLQEARK